MGTARAGRRPRGRSRGRGRREAAVGGEEALDAGRTRRGPACRARASGRRGHGWGGWCRCPIVEPVYAHEPPRAVVFDFNGTISDDEPLLAELCALIFGRDRDRGPERALLRRVRRATPTPRSSSASCRRRPLRPAVAEGLLDRRTELYLDRAGTGETVHPPVVACVREIADARAGRGRLRRRPGGGRGRARGQRPARLLAAIVAAEDVERGKPDPEGYLIALARLGVPEPTRCRSRTPTSASWRRSPPGCGASASAPRCRPTGSRRRGRGGRGRP